LLEDCQQVVVVPVVGATTHARNAFAQGRGHGGGEE
jgi:hypothetical protein